MKLAMPMHGYAFRFSVAHAHYEKLATGTYGGPDACFPPYLWRLPFFYLDVLCSKLWQWHDLLPIYQGTISKIEKQFREHGHGRQLKKNLPNKLSDDQKLDVILMLEENPHTSSRQTASALNISHSSILRVLTENQMHPYKLVLTNELAEDDFDRRILFCEQMMQMVDDNTLQIENVIFSICAPK
ncbi:hypothetical protein NQ318_015562 [Aromia moschata]|uniref:Transposase n=1 Tax=Aromia moschata TaxID=1265417 RepID=A0AAV8XKK9_9CUCU|nr:hypothetical protein NQ318_015562 [Aromia moschata]